MAATAIRDLLEAAFPGGQVEVEDRTGGGDHFQVTVVSEAFNGLPLIQQHKLVNAGARRAARRRHHPRASHPNEGNRMSTLQDQIKHVIDTEPVVVFMKGTPEAPACGNSMRALQALWQAGAPITGVDVLPDPRIRQELSALTEWPTIPQVFVKGELIGGADITEELNASGELREKIDGALGAEHAQTVQTVALALD